MTTGRTFICYAHGHQGSWQAICADLDIAVQGRTLNEVRDALDAAIQSYVEDALAEEPATANQLLNRRAPWHVRARLALAVMGYKLRSHLMSNGGKESASSFDVPCHV